MDGGKGREGWERDDVGWLVAGEGAVRLGSSGWVIRKEAETDGHQRGPSEAADGGGGGISEQQNGSGHESGAEVARPAHRRNRTQTLATGHGCRLSLHEMNHDFISESRAQNPSISQDEGRAQTRNRPD